MSFELFQKDFHISANSQQEKAISKVEGPTLLLAVPGSGKTTVIVNRTGYMVLCCGIPAGDILTLTFTNEAAKQMQDRFCDRFGSEVAGNLNFSTIHSFCYSVINRCRGRFGISVPQLEPENAALIKRAFHAVTGEFASENAVKELTQKLTYAKNMMYGEDQIAEMESAEVSFPKFYKKYESLKRTTKKMDFDDQLLLAHQCLKNHPSLLQEYQNRYRFISVDEAQDTSYIQHEIIKMLVEKSHNVFMVGDEDQSIYGFRAAYPEALTSFPQTYPKAEILYMETNYRSTGKIINLASEFIKQNTARFEKHMSTPNEPGEDVKHTILQDAGLQYRHLVGRFQAGIGSIETTAVIYRNNESALPLIDLLDREGIPFHYKEGGGDAFFSYFLVSDILALLQLSQDRGNIKEYAKVYYKLGAYLSKKTIDLLKLKKTGRKRFNVFQTLAAEPEFSRQKKRLDEIDMTLKQISGRKPYEAIQGILHELRYNDYVVEMRKNGYSEQGMLQKLNTLLALSMEYTTITTFLARLEFLSGFKGKSERCNLTLSTIHASKGLEFDNVIIIDAYEGILPSERAMKDRKNGNRPPYEEEVRLFYVAATRAKKKLEIITSTKRFGKPIAISPFVDQFLGKKPAVPLLAENPKKRSNTAASKNPALALAKQNLAGINTPVINVDYRYRPGVKIEHHKLGLGFVVKSEGNVLSVMFGQEVKHLDFAKCMENGYIRLA